MPAVEEDELRQLIDADRIGGISIDTSVFDRYGCNLGSPALTGLAQFSQGETRLLLSRVIVEEIKAHIAKDAADTQQQLNSALKKHQRRWQRDLDQQAIDEILVAGRTPQEIAEQQFAAFVETVQPILVDADGRVTHADVLNLYFAARPPFSTNEKKKSEFPDALALLSIGAWATEENTMVLVVSGDKDWKAFADNSERVVWVEELPTALDFFNRQASAIARRAVALLRQNEAPALHQEISGAIESFLDGFEPDISADSMFEYDLNIIEGRLQQWEIENAVVPQVLSADDETVVFSLLTKATVKFIADFSFSVRDSVDKDYVYMGSDTKEVDQ